MNHLFRHVAGTSLVVLLLLFAAADAQRRPPPKPKPKPKQAEDVKRLMRDNNPVEALRRLQPNFRGEPIEGEKLTLTLEAVEALAVKAEAEPHPVAALAEVRAARSLAGDMPAEVRARLERLDRSAERRVLIEGLTAVKAKASAGAWGEAPEAARAAAIVLGDRRLEDTRAVESAEFRVRLAEARVLVAQMRERADRAQATVGFADVLAAAKDATFQKVDRGNLSDDLVRRLDGLRATADVFRHVAGVWPGAPDVAAMKASVERFERGLADADAADAGLGKALLMDLAVRALLAGYPEAALALWPADAPKEYAAALSRDLKALTLGEGKVTTAALGDFGPNRPHGLDVIVPTKQREGWKPPAIEKEVNSPLARAEKAEVKLKASAAKAVRAERVAAEAKAAETAKALATLYDRVLVPELVERKKLVAVEAELNRRLTPGERVWVRERLQEKTPREIAAELKERPADPGEEEKAFLAEVRRRLGRDLQEGEAARASRLRRQGRTSAEVAELLRQ